MNPLNLRAFLRLLKRNKLYTGIIVISFSISLMFVLLLSVYIKNEYSVDKFHENKDRIYRLVYHLVSNNNSQSAFAPPTGKLLADNYPEIETYTRTFNREGYAANSEGRKIGIKYLMADSAFFSMFSFKLIEGLPQNAFAQRKSIVLSRSFALKLFDSIPELGSFVKLNNEFDYQITGIMDDFPGNTHFHKFDAILDFPSLADQWNYPQLLTGFENNSFGLYVMLKPNTNISTKVPEIIKLFKEVNWLYKKGFATDLYFEPLTDVYFSNAISQGGIKQNSESRIKIFSVISLLILLLSIINYVNLTVAQSGSRIREFGIKKLLGGKRLEFILQYIMESTFLCMVAFILSLLLSYLYVPVFNALMKTNIIITDIFTTSLLMFSIIAVFIIGIISGLVPAVRISNLNSISVIKGVDRLKEKRIYSRVLISFQYFLISVLLLGSIFTSKQLKFMLGFELGFNKENIIWIDNMGNAINGKSSNTFKAILESIPGVLHVCNVRGTPLDGGNNNSMNYEGKSISFQTFDVDTSYFGMMGMEVRHTGVALSGDMIWLNETAVREMDLPDVPLSAKIYGKERPVYGVVKDFHFKNLQQSIGPAFFQVMKPDYMPWSILIKVSSKNLNSTVARIEKEYDKITNGTPIIMGFMEESLHQWYQEEEKLSKLIKSYALLTIIISVMGLFAISTYYCQQKFKEIGIRKVNGAKIKEVMIMLNKDFVKWVAIAFVFACPIAWYAMHKWLENFAYKTELSWWIFALAGVLAMGIALMTVSWQSWRAARRNPLEALRYE